MLSIDNMQFFPIVPRIDLCVLGGFASERKMLPRNQTLLPVMSFLAFSFRIQYFKPQSVILPAKWGQIGEGIFPLDYPFPKEYFLVIRFHLFAINPAS
jgi:hypothetical protein